MNSYEKEKIEKNEHKGCPVCGSKETGKWFSPTGVSGNSETLYYCKKCGVIRIWL